MLRDCEKMVLIPSTSTNEWSQIDEKNLMMASNGGSDIEKPIQDSQQQQQQQQQQQPLNCPRCDSANTKFCYYNNYSLSQPRHFCKACKRYWTRGGTLRNVPVGGGCRKNKRIKRPSVNSSTNDHIAPNSISVATTTNPSYQNDIHGATRNIDLPSTITSNHLTPLFYGLTNGSSDHLNVPFSRLFNSRVLSTTDEGQVYSLAADNIPGLMDRRAGLVSSSGVLMGENYGHGFNSTKQIQDVVTTSSSSLLSSYPMFGSSSSTSNSTSTMASLIASSFQQQKFISNSNNFHSLAPYEELQMSGNNNVEGGSEIMLKEEKTEGGNGQNRLNWNNLSNHQSQIHEQIISSNDPSIPWNGVWFDPSNMGSNSVPSLI